MGLFEKLFGKPKTKTGLHWKTISDPDPTWSMWDGNLLGEELTRAAIERFSTACSKLKPEVQGVSTGPSIKLVQRMCDGYPNSQMTWPTFLGRVAALYDTYGTAFVVRTYERDGFTPDGLWPLAFDTVDVVEVQGKPWYRFTTLEGRTLACPPEDVCVMAKLQVRSDLFGEPNSIDATMQLIHAQNQAQRNAIKSGAKVKFIAALNGMVKPDDLKKRREEFLDANFTGDDPGGLLVYDNTFVNMQQVEPQRYTLADTEMERIQNGVYNYFGINEDILQNKYLEDVWGAWYEGKIEPFSVKLGEGITRLVFTPTQVHHGMRVTFSSNRLEYASNPSKRNMVRDMVDRGLMSINEGREVLQLPPIEGGDIRVIRGEYVNASLLEQLSAMQVTGGGRMPKNVNDDGLLDPEGDDDLYGDSDGHGKDDFDY